MMLFTAISRNGDCYEAAGKFVMDESMFGRDKGLTLVHGIVTGQGPIDGLEYGHAWVESNGTVIDRSNGRNIKMPRSAYYALGQVGKTYKYDFEHVRKKILDSGHWGPWDLKSRY